MNNKNQKRLVLILALVVMITVMTVGYAAFSTDLFISGTANITAEWLVKFTEIKEGTMVGAKTVGTPTISEDTTTATFEVDLAYPGASATYNIVVENAGSIDAKLNSIDGVDAANAAQPNGVTFAVTGVSEGDELASGAKKTVTVTVTWDADDTSVPTTTSKTATITLNYVQDTD